ncbi:MAG TPA: type II toxin-antitoxin system prevent-host-death family antitoxin [Conexibacter sp.]|nr:type II toxin-antitoxin system prevent-host-death family antitoxin [Conexibacter sp.]
MTLVNIQAAHARLPELLDCVEQGEQIVIARNGTPVVELVPYARRASRARAAFFGSMKGQIDMSRFDEADEEIAREFGMLD